MLTLSVDTSCDDSAVALMDGTRPLAERIYSQQVHAGLGGVVPELASRMHLEILPGLAAGLLEEAAVRPGDVEVYAATAGPGLIGSLLVGLSWAKAAAFSSGRRFLGINHVASHLFIHYDGTTVVEFPAAALVASGGHTSLFLLGSWEDIRFLGGTRDDAAGEAFDKTAKLLGLGYPGGAELDRMAGAGNPYETVLPAPLDDPDLPEFSFSGLKTAVRSLWEKGMRVEDIAACFCRTVSSILCSKLLTQAGASGARSVLTAGGVSANSFLRSELTGECRRRGFALHMPEPGWTTDNAVMVGRAAAAVLDHDPGASTPFSCNAFARWSGSRLEPLCGG